MNNVFMLALMAAPIAASAAWSIGSLDISTDPELSGAGPGNGNKVSVGGILEDGAAPQGRFYVVFRAIVSADANDTYERTHTEYVVRTATNSVEKAFYVGYAKSWRIGFGPTYADAQLNIIASAVRLNGEWLVNGTRSKPVMGIDSGRRVTVEFDPEGGSVIEVLGSTDLKTWAPATAKSRFFKAIQKEASK